MKNTDTILKALKHCVFESVNCKVCGHPVEAERVIKHMRELGATDIKIGQYIASYKVEGCDVTICL